MGARMVRERMTCLLCRGLISFKARSQDRFLDHMKEEHSVRYDFEVLLVTTLMNEAEKKTLVFKNKEKFQPIKSNNENEQTAKITQPEKICQEDVLAENMPSKKDLNTPILEVDVPDNTSIVIEDRPVEPEKQNIEGVFKCKTCGKYVKQSVLAEHKAKHAKYNSGNDETLLIESPEKDKFNAERKTNDNDPKVDHTNTLETKLKENMKRKNYDEDWQENEKDDSDDEDWDAKPKKSKAKKVGKFSCPQCQKKFDSNTGVSTHIRMAHAPVRVKDVSKINLEKRKLIQTSKTVVLSRDL